MAKKNDETIRLINDIRDLIYQYSLETGIAVKQVYIKWLSLGIFPDNKMTSTLHITIDNTEME